MLFNLSKGKTGDDVCETMGRCIIAQVKSLAFKRAELPPHLRKKVYLIIDEADTFLRRDTSISIILKEARKYGVHLILATQNLISGAETTQLKRNILNNTNTKIIGMNGLSTLKPLAHETGICLSNLQRLGQHQFFIKAGTKKPMVHHLSHVLHANSPLLLSRKKVRQQTQYFVFESTYYAVIP